jgi:uncharacterized linocin/CFP29 family protein
MSRWLPTVVAVLAILGQVFWFGQRTGTIETNVKVLADNQSVMSGQLRDMLPRSEYNAAQVYAVREMQEVKQGVLRMENKIEATNTKIDQLIMRRP